MNADLLSQYKIQNTASIIEAMEKIDLNRKRFLIAVDSDGKVLGTLTDGDIRRALIKSNTLNGTISGIYNKDFTYITEKDTLPQVVESFKKEGVEFLPILDDQKRLCNVITKSNLHVLILQNILYNSCLNFSLLDDSLLEHEIYPRPWGYFKTVLLSKYCQCKTISVNPQSSISLQKHLQREEHWIVIHGTGFAVVGENKFSIENGCCVHIPKNTIHRLINISEDDTLMVIEVQLGEYFGEDDIIRFEDEYGRV